MKKMFLFFVLLVSLSFAQKGIIDESPIFSKLTLDNPTEALWDIKFNYDLAAITGANGNAGVVYIHTLQQFWVSRWGSGIIKVISKTGAIVDSFTLSVTGTRGMAFDGQHVYHSVNTGTLQKVDPVTRTIVGTVTLPSGVTARFITYDPTANSGAGGFWLGNWNAGALNYYLVSKTGAQLRVITNTAITGTYGIAFDNWSTGGPFLWVWSQGLGAGTPQNLIQLNYATGLATGVQHDVRADVGIGQPSTSGIAGGLFITDQLVPGICVLGGVMQGAPDKLFGYELATVIPVELTSFTSSVGINEINLSWTTASELNNHGFEIQRKAENADFVTIGFVSGAGTTAEEHNYNFTDNKVVAGKYSYRLKQLDFDGKYSFSKEVEVELSNPATFSLEKNYPNPFNPSTNLSFSLAVDSKVSLKVFNVLGQEVSTLINSNLTAGQHSIQFNASNLISGIYFARLEAAGIDGQSFSAVTKMILNK